jgi:nicotinate phosphoribosyltransferase
MRANLNPALVDVPVRHLRGGFFTAAYFNRTKSVLERFGSHVRALQQVFQKRDDATLCGIGEVALVLSQCAGWYCDPERARSLLADLLAAEREIAAFPFRKGGHKKLPSLCAERGRIAEELDSLWKSAAGEIELKGLSDGDRITAIETAMTIEGDYSAFAHMESVYLGILAARTTVASNARWAVDAAHGKQVLFFADRFWDFRCQSGDGYAAKVGGIDMVCTDAQGYWIGQTGIGTLPHALIAAYNGDTVEAAKRFNEAFPDVNLIVLVDFDNDCVETSLAVARALGEKLWGVRLDTAETMVDFSIIRGKQMGRIQPTGVNPLLVENVRRALNREKFDHVKIVVSGGFTAEKIAHFEKYMVPVDAYGVGSYFLKGGIDFTSDVVMVDGKPCAKVGREFRPNQRLKRIPLR